LSIGRHLTTDGTSSQKSFSTERSFKHAKDYRPSKKIYKQILKDISEEAAFINLNINNINEVFRDRVKDTIFIRFNYLLRCPL